MMMSFTCNTCEVEYDDVESHRSHYKSDWHRYNLRRRQVELAPVPFEAFRKRKAAVLEKRRKEDEREEEEKSQRLRCDLCRKDFATLNAQKQHYRSKKHREAAKRAERKRKTCVPCPKISPKMKDDSQKKKAPPVFEPRKITALECLFCVHKSESVEKNLQHMKERHEFVLPEAESICNVKGLLEYLGEKVGVGHLCLWCQKGFSSIPAVRAHMVDRGHCRIPFEVKYDLEEYFAFYKYGPLRLDSSDAAHAWHAAVKACTTDYDSTKNKLKPSEWGRVLEIDENEELVLHDGRRVGNRKYKHIYKQNFAPEDDRPEVLANRKMLLERVVGPEAAKEMMLASRGEIRASRSVALSLHHARDRRAAKLAAQRAVDIKKREFDRRRLDVGIQMNKVNVSKIPHRRGVFVSWKT